MFPTRKLKIWHICVFIFVALLIAALVTTSVFLGLEVEKNKEAGNMIEGAYQYEYYMFLEQLMVLDSELSKLAVSNSQLLREEFLFGAVISAQKAADCASKMLYERGHMTSIVRVFSDMSAWCKVLLSQVEAGRALNAEDKQDFVKMRAFVTDVAQRLGGFADAVIENGYSSRKDLSKRKDAFIAVVDEICAAIESYQLFLPDSERTKPKALSGEEISREDAQVVLHSALGGRSLSKIEGVGESVASIATYIFAFEIDGVSATAAVSKVGGKLIDFYCNDLADDPQYTQEDVIAQAKTFVEAQGLKEMHLYNQTLSGGYVLAEFVPMQDGATLCEDKISIKISLQTGRVVGFNSACYYQNHEKRKIIAPIITSAEAAAKLGDAEIISVRLELIKPINTEILCFVVRCKVAGEIYTVAIDAASGIEVCVKRVVEGENGEMCV